MRILFDTDVIMDFILKRENFSDDAEKAIALCMDKGIKCCIAAHAVPIIEPSEFIKKF